MKKFLMYLKRQCNYNNLNLSISILTIYKACRKFKIEILSPIYTPIAQFILYINEASFGINLKVRGILK